MASQNLNGIIEFQSNSLELVNFALEKVEIDSFQNGSKPEYKVWPM